MIVTKNNKKTHTTVLVSLNTVDTLDRQKRRSYVIFLVLLSLLLFYMHKFAHEILIITELNNWRKRYLAEYHNKTNETIYILLIYH